MQCWSYNIIAFRSTSNNLLVLLDLLILFHSRKDFYLIAYIEAMKFNFEIDPCFSHQYSSLLGQINILALWRVRLENWSRRNWSTRYCTYRRERPSLLDLLSEFGLISDGWLGSISPLGDWAKHLSVEGLRPWDWSYPVLQYLREWPTPTVIIFDMSTVVKPQQPPPPCETLTKVFLYELSVEIISTR